MACRDGLKLAVQLGLQRVELETDCLQLVQLWNKKAVQRSIIDLITKEIDELCLASQDFSFSYVNRVCNKVAHSLAKQVLGSHFWRRGM